jgi:hypothetical protein
MIFASCLEVVQRIDSVSCRKMLELLGTLIIVHESSGHSINVSSDSNLAALAALIFWMETLLEITLMKMEAVGEIISYRLGKVTICPMFLQQWSREFDWVYNRALTVIRLHSYFQYEFTTENIGHDKLMTWLCEQVPSSGLLSIFCDDQQQAADKVTVQANAWMCEYKSVIRQQTNSKIEVNTDTVNNPFALFEYLRKFYSLCQDR